MHTYTAPLALVLVAGCASGSVVPGIVCDADQDGHEGPWCGGDDCDDTEADRFSGCTAVGGDDDSAVEDLEPYTETVNCEDTWTVEGWHFGYQVADTSRPPFALAIYTANPEWLACIEQVLEPYRVVGEYQINEQGFIIIGDGAGCTGRNSCSEDDPFILTETSVTLVVYPAM